MRSTSYTPGEGVKAWWASLTPAERSAHARKSAATRARRKGAAQAVRTRRRNHRMGNKPAIDPTGPDAVTIEKMYREGYSGPAIAERISYMYPKISAGAIYGVLRRRGVEMRGAGGGEGAHESPNGTTATTPFTDTLGWNPYAQLEQMKAYREKLSRAIDALEAYCTAVTGAQ